MLHITMAFFAILGTYLHIALIEAPQVSLAAHSKPTIASIKWNRSATSFAAVCTAPCIPQGASQRLNIT